MEIFPNIIRLAEADDVQSWYLGTTGDHHAAVPFLNLL